MGAPRHVTRGVVVACGARRRVRDGPRTARTPTSPFSSLTSSSSAVSPSCSRSRYSSSFPGSDASAIVTWTPRSSIGSVLGPVAGAAASVARSAAGALALGRADEARAHSEQADREEERADGGAAPEALPPPCRSPTLAKPLVRVDGWEQHRHRGVDHSAALVESPRGPLRSHHSAPRSTRAASASIRTTPELMQPSSLDVRVDRYFRVFRNSRYPFIDVKAQQEELTELVEVDGEEAFILHPGEFVLGSTLERVTLPDDLVARLEGKSSLGRLGLLIHSTAGFIDPGWDGHVTLELSNVANLPITIYPGDEDRPALVRAAHRGGRAAVRVEGIGSKYQGQRGPTPSRYWQNFTTTTRATRAGRSRRVAALDPHEKRAERARAAPRRSAAAKYSSICATWRLRRLAAASRRPRRSAPRRRPADRSHTRRARRSVTRSSPSSRRVIPDAVRSTCPARSTRRIRRSGARARRSSTS